MSLLRPRVRDDRWRRVRLAPLIGREGRPVRRAALHWAVWVVVVIGAGVAGVALSFVGYMLAFVVTIWLTIGFPCDLSYGLPEELEFWLGVLVAAFYLSTIPSTLLVLHPVWRWRARAGARRAGLCACCGYALAGLAREEDGCTVCPECGAAWRLQGEGTNGQRDQGTEGSEIGHG